MTAKLELMHRRKTAALVKVANTLLKDPHGRHWGYGTSRSAGVRSSVMYGMFDRMMEDGWATDGWESPSEAAGRPPRRYYELTDLGREQLAQIVGAAAALDAATVAMSRKASATGMPSPR